MKHCLLIALLLCRFAAAADEDTQVFRAGAATANITPPLGSLIVGGFRPYPAEHIHDELHVRCLVLDDGATQVAFAICDNVGIAREVFDAARAMITAETGLAADHVLMSATHTHSGPSARGWKRLVPSELSDYQQFLARRIADAVRCALNNREPALIAWGSVAEPSQLFNRRFYCTDPELLKNPFGGVDQVRMNPPRQHPGIVRPAGPIDPEISFLAVQSSDGRQIALLANYSLHYVGGVRGADISADYFAIFGERLGELLGAAKQDPPFVGIMTNGTSGDVISANFQAEAQKYAPYEKMHRVADVVAQRVHEAYTALKFQEHVTLAATLRELPVGVRNPSPELLEWARTTLAKPEDAPKYMDLERDYAQRILNLEDAPQQISIPLQAVRIGELGIVAIPFEVFAETGLSIKEHSPLRPTFAISLANGSYGYLPTPEQHALGGYETWLGTNFVETDASEKIERTLLEMLSDLLRK